MALSSKQARILQVIKDHIEISGMSPTLREIARTVGLSSISTVSGHLDRLERDGYITRSYGLSRSIKIKDCKSSQ